MRVMAHGAGNSQVIFSARQTLLRIVGGYSPGRQRIAPFVTGAAGGGCILDEGAVLLLQRDCVGRELPFIDEGMMEPTVAVGAALSQGGRVTQHRHMCQRRISRTGRSIRILGVGVAGTVTALALDVVVRRILHHVPPSRRSGRIALVADGVTRLAERLGRTGVEQSGVRIGVSRVDPARLVAGVAVTAGGVLIAAGEVAEETGVCVRGRIDGLAVDDLLVGTARKQHYRQSGNARDLPAGESLGHRPTLKTVSL